MNLGFDAKRALFNRSGLGNYSRSTIRLLSHFYPDNKYYLFSATNSQDLFQPTGNQFLITPEPGFYSSFPSFWRSVGISKQLKRVHPDIYHGLSNELPWNIKQTGVKSVVTIHDLIFLRHPEYYPVIDRQLYLFKFSHACGVADKIIATSEATKADIITFFGTDPQKIEVVYQSCNPVFRIPVLDETKYNIRKKYNLPEKFILYLGTIEKRKNALTLIKAYLNQQIDVPLLLAGKPTAYLDEIKDFIKNNAACDRILFRHNIESADLPALYQSAEVFIFPSIIEGFGIPILEALNSGVPVITSHGSCFGETGGNAALYCDPLNVTELGNCMKTVLSDSAIRKSMIERGFEHSKKFNEENVSANLMKVYLQILK